MSSSFIISLKNTVVMNAELSPANSISSDVSFYSSYKGALWRLKVFSVDLCTANCRRSTCREYGGDPKQFVMVDVSATGRWCSFFGSAFL